MKLIDLHKEWCEKGELHGNGLCNSVPDEYRDLLESLAPTDNDLEVLYKENMPPILWGYFVSYGKCFDIRKRMREYTPLRQTIVLLICAMKNEI